MSSNDPKYPLVAVGFQLGYNDGANKGFWRVQPRQKLGEDKGQWIKMGAELRLYYKNLKGLIDSVPGIALGSDGTPNGVRVLIQGQEAKGFMDGIFGFDVNNVRVAEGLLSDEYLKSQGIEAGVPSDVNPDLLPNIADIPRADITPDDIRLANEGIESPEGKENEEFKNTPEGQEIARLEEAETVSSEELKKIVEPATARAEKPKAYGMRNRQDFVGLPDGTILDEYERAQFYPNPDSYDGPFGPVWRSIIKQDGKWFNLGKNGKAVGKPLTTGQVAEKLRSNSLADRGAASKIDENGNQVAVWADEVISDPAKQDAAEPEMSDEDYDRAVDALDNLGVRGPRGVGKPRTAAREDLDSLLDEESLQELAEDIYYQREGTKRAGNLSKALGVDNPAVDAYGDDGQDPQWNEVYNKTWKDIAKKIFSDPNVVDAKAALPYGREDAYEDDVDPDLLSQALGNLAADLGIAAKKALLPVAPPKEKAEPAAKKPASKAKTANDLDPEALAALKEKNAVPQDVSTLRSRTETINNIVNDAYDKDEKTINRTLKKLHGFLGKSGTDPIGTPAVIERLSNIVEAIGGTPYTPPAPKKEEDKFPERGKQNIEDYKVGDNVYVYDDSEFGDETTVDMGKVVGIDKNSGGAPVLKVKFDNDVDPNRSWPVEQKDLSPVSEADLKAKELLERGMAGEKGDDLWETIADAPIDFDEDFNEDDLEVVEDKDPTASDDLIPDVSDTPETVTTEELLEGTEDEPKYDRSSLISNEELDAMGSAEEYIDDFGGFAPSAEQTRGLNAIVKAKLRTVIDALAGAGKTTLLIGAANSIGRLRPKERVLILTFNKKNAVDAKRKANRINTDARTTHSVAFAELTANQKKSFNYKQAGVASSDREIATVLELDDTFFAGENWSPADTAFLLNKAITKFCNSADEEITEDHFRRALVQMKGDEGPDYGSLEIPKKFMDAANRYWDNVSSDEKVGYYDKATKKLVGKKRIRVTHDHSLKLWSLSSPDLTRIVINGEPVSVTFFDEAQDTNPAVAKVIAGNKDKVQLAYVGDPNQAIYGFRDAENALEDAKEDAEAIVDLTVTRRFGQGLTAAANAFLNLLGARSRIRGVGEGGEQMSPENMPDGPDKAHLVRTNIGGLDAIFNYMEQGKTVGALSVFYEELEKSIYHLKWLSEDFSTRGKDPKTPDGRDAYSEDFVGIRNFKDLYDKAKKDPKSRAARWYNLVTIQADGDIKKFETLLEKLVVDNRDLGTTARDIDTFTGAAGVLWITKNGKNLDYSIDDNGMVSMQGDASFERVEGVPFKDILKSMGMRFNWDEKVWQTMLPDDEEREAFITAVANRIPNRIEDSPIPDVVISTAHRAKGLEWDYVVIGDDFPEPKESLKTGEIEWPSEEELRLAYVAVTRARKGLSTGSLAWGENYEGRDGLARANDALGRVRDFGSAAWDYYDQQGEEGSSSQSAPAESNFEALDYENYNSGDIDDEFGPILSATPDDIPFVKDWVQLRPGEYSKYLSGVRWNIRQNRDGSIVVRPRTNEPELGSTKYNSWEEVEAAFPSLIETGNVVGRQKLKEALQPYDTDGKLAQLIDSGASADEVNAALTKTDAWSDAVEGETAPLSTIAARLSKYDGQKDVIPTGKKRKTAKPDTVVKKPFVPSRAAEFYEENPDRQDDGGSVDRTPYDAETLAKIKTDGKARNVKRALLRAFPGAMVSPDGRVIVYRQTKTEQYGPAAGQDREFEMSVMEGKDGTFTLINSVRNPGTGKSETYYHYKDYHSLASLIGDREKQSASIERLLSYYFDRDEDEFPFPGKTPKDQKDWAKMYGGVAGSIAYLRRGDFDKILEDPSSDDTQLKLRTPSEHAILALNGRDRRFNKSTDAWWTQMRKEKASLFQALESGDVETSTAIFRSYINGVPDTKDAKDSVKRVIFNAMDALYPNPDDARAKKALISKISDEIDQELSPSGSVVKPHLSRNGRLVQEGNYVRWTNNEGETVVGLVTGLLGADNPNGGKYFYSDFAYVTFNNRDEKDAVLLNTKNMEVLDGEETLSDYKSWIREDDLKLRRYEEAGFTFDPETGIFYDADGNPVDRLAGDDDGDGDGDGDGDDDGDGGDEGDGTTDDSDDTEGDEGSQDPDTTGPETPTIEPKDIKDLAEGDKVYDDEDNLVGTVKSAKAAKYKGDPGYVVEFEDGKKSFYPEGESVRSESDITKQTTPAALRKRAANLGLAVPVSSSLTKNSRGKPLPAKATKTLPTRKVSTSSDDGAINVEGRRGKIGVKPTPEAKAAKDEMMAIGASAWQLAEPEIVKRANQAGLEGGSIEEIYDNIQADEATLNELDQRRYPISRELDALIAKEYGDNPDISEAKAAGYDFSTREGISKFFADNPEFSGFQRGTAGAQGLFSISRDKEKMSKFLELKSAKKDAETAFVQASDAKKAKGRKIRKAQRDGTLATLKKLGVKFDSVTFKEFNEVANGSGVYDDAGKPVLDGSNLAAAKALQEAFQYIPRNIILAFANKLGAAFGMRTGGGLILNRKAVSRGDFSSVPGYGTYRIRVSKHGRDAIVDGDSEYTDTMLHEFWHGLQKELPNVRQLEHAWLFDRVVKSDNNGNQTLPKIDVIYGRNKELGFESDLAEPYMAKQYERKSTGVFFNPEDNASEVSTVLMQDMFTSPNLASYQNKGAEVTAGRTPKTRQVVNNAYYDKETDSWFTDKTKSTKIDDVVSVKGRSIEQGVDKDLKALGMGLLLVLNDWSATEGVGPGNAVDDDDK